MAGNLNPRDPEFTGKNPVNVPIKPRDKFRKVVTPPKSANYRNQGEGDWGKGK